MSRENFMKDLKQPTPTPTPQNNSLLNFIKVLSEKYPDCSISLEKIERRHSDKKDDFISIKSKNSEKPINFRIPAKRFDLSIYQSSPDYDILNYRYDLYNTIYKSKIIEQFIKERKYLQERFPNVIFSTKIRQKSKFSYEDKIIERMTANQYLDDSSKKDYFIKDVIAGRHVIDSIDGNDDPEVLKNLCFEFEQALKEFRESEKGSDFRTVLKKDYISNPKENGYQSIHLINEDSQNPDCSYETQIRTFDMEEQSKKDEKIAHDTYKPRIIDQFASLRLPIYTSITQFNDENGEPIVYTSSIEDAFYHFFGISFSQYSTELNAVMPVITDIRNELYFKEQSIQPQIQK